MPRREDDVAPRSAPRPRTLFLAGGFVLALVATLAVFLTDNPRYLRVAVVAVAWAFVLAMFAAGRRGSEGATAALRVSELRRAYELELEREVAARREYELELEKELRRENQEAMREELDALRTDLAALADLRDEVARVSALRGDIAELSGLRDEVARVAALRDDVAALTALRQELGQLGELRADVGRLRAELTEKLSSEMLVERISLRTQTGRLTGEPGRRLDGPSRSLEGWTDDPPRELTGGWPAVRLDEPRPTQQFEQVRVERPSLRPSRHSADEPMAPRPTATFSMTAPPSPTPVSRPIPAVPPVPVRPPSAPRDRLGARSRPDTPPPVPFLPEVPRRRQTDDGTTDASEPAASRSTERPATPPSVRVEDRGGYRVALPAEPPRAPAGDNRLAEILAENGVSPSTGGRRRRRYRDDGADDVLARVLGRD